MRLNMPQEPLLKAVYCGQYGAVRKLLEADADVNTRGESSETALICAVVMGRRSIAQLLIDAGADLHATNMYGATPLMFAAERGDAMIVRRLLKEDVDLNAYDRNGVTALMLAAGGGKLEVVKLLIMSGADMAARDLGGDAAVDWADRSNHVVVRELLRNSKGVQFRRQRDKEAAIPEEAGTGASGSISDRLPGMAARALIWLGLAGLCIEMKNMLFPHSYAAQVLLVWMTLFNAAYFLFTSESVPPGARDHGIMARSWRWFRLRRTFTRSDMEAVFFITVFVIVAAFMGKRLDWSHTTYYLVTLLGFVIVVNKGKLTSRRRSRLKSRRLPEEFELRSLPSWLSLLPRVMPRRRKRPEGF